MGAGSREKSSLRAWVEARVEMEKRVATRSEGVVVASEGEAPGVVGERAHIARRAVSSPSLRAQTVVTLALNKQGVRSRSSAAWPERMTANHIPRSYIGEIYRSDWGDLSNHAPRTCVPS